MEIRKIRYRKMASGGKERVVVLGGYVRQIDTIKKTKKGAETRAKTLNEQKWKGYWWKHKVVKTDKGYAVVLLPLHIGTAQDKKNNSIKVQRKFLS